MHDRVRLLDDPILRVPCTEVPLGFIGMNPILTRMNETMIAEAGVGLAANQIGFSYRIFILKNLEVSQGFEAYINPVILSVSDEMVDHENEGCLSLPGAQATTKRHVSLLLQWEDELGKKYNREISGFQSFAVQHEMDHLNGKLYIDQFGPVRRGMIVAKHKKYLRVSRRS